MTNYLISVVGMALLSTVADLILPSGRMSSVVRSMLALFLFFVIVSKPSRLFELILFAVSSV